MKIKDSVVLSGDTLIGVSAFLLLFFLRAKKTFPFMKREDKIAIFFWCLIKSIINLVNKNKKEADSK